MCKGYDNANPKESWPNPHFYGGPMSSSGLLKVVDDVYAIMNSLSDMIQ